MNDMFRILILEDIPSDVELAVRALRKADLVFEYRVASSEQGLRQELDSFCPDVILSDYNMGSFDGLDALNIIQAECPELAFIIFTGSNNEEVAVDCLKKGAWDYILKDNIVRLGSAVDSALEKKRNREQVLQAEKALQESEARFSLAMDASSDGLYDWNLKTNSIYYSPGWKKMLGYKDHELENDFSVWEATTDPEDVKQAWELQQQLITKKIDRFVIEMKMKHKDGHWVDILSRAKVIFNDQGEAIRMIGTHTDITQRKRAEAALLESEGKFQQAVLLSPIPIMIHNENGEVIHLSAGWTRLSGYTIKDIPTLPEWTQKAYGEKGPAVKLYIEDLFSLDTTEDNGEWQITAKDGSKRIWHFYTTPLVTSAGRKRVLLSTAVDLTEQKNAEQVLKESLEQNKSITQTAADAIISIDSDGTIKSWNQAAEKIFGYTEDEMLGLELQQIIPDQMKQNHVRGLKRIKSGSEAKLMGHTIEISAVRKDGSHFPIELSLSSWLLNDQQHFTGIIRDISQRKRAEEKIAESLLSAKQANSVKDQFIANISHEIRTPLNAIIGFSDLFRQRYGGMVSDKDKDIFGFITSSSNRLMRTVDSILNISQLDAGTVKIQPRVFDLNYLVRAVLGEIKPSADEKALELLFITKDHEALVFVDNYSLHQAILNLVENAIKYTLKGEVELKLTQVKGRYRLSIRDTGIGISEAFKQRIYQPYTQESEGFTKNYQGIGLGLALAKRYLELNGVDLELESQKNVGTTFTLIFPKYERE